MIFLNTFKTVYCKEKKSS